METNVGDPGVFFDSFQILAIAFAQTEIGPAGTEHRSQKWGKGRVGAAASTVMLSSAVSL
jgi:hypothetical protein